jgi:hypothetical protein
MSFTGNDRKQLAYYSRQSSSIDFLEYREDLISDSNSLVVPFSNKYDAMAAMDFNEDGYDDIVLLNFNSNRATYLLNVDGQALRPLSVNLPLVGRPEFVSFAPTPGRNKVRFLMSPYGDRSLLFLVTRKSGILPISCLSSLSPNTCLLLGDFDLDGLVDLAVGHFVE